MIEAGGFGQRLLSALIDSPTLLITLLIIYYN